MRQPTEPAAYIQAAVWGSGVRDARHCSDPGGGELLNHISISLSGLHALRFYPDAHADTLGLPARQVLAQMVAKLPPCEAVQLERVSR